MAPRSRRGTWGLGWFCRGTEDGLYKRVASKVRAST